MASRMPCFSSASGTGVIMRNMIRRGPAGSSDHCRQVASVRGAGAERPHLCAVSALFFKLWLIQITYILYRKRKGVEVFVSLALVIGDFREACQNHQNETEQDHNTEASNQQHKKTQQKFDTILCQFRHLVHDPL